MKPKERPMSGTSKSPYKTHASTYLVGRTLECVVILEILLERVVKKENMGHIFVTHVTTSTPID